MNVDVQASNPPYDFLSGVCMSPLNLFLKKCSGVLDAFSRKISGTMLVMFLHQTKHGECLRSSSFLQNQLFLEKNGKPSDCKAV